MKISNKSFDKYEESARIFIQRFKFLKEEKDSDSVGD